MIQLNQVSKTFDHGATWAVHELTLTVRQGELMALVGASGCGKTTTLKMINRLVALSEGDILLDGESIRQRDPVQLRRHIGYVFQGIGLFPHYTVGENIAVVPRLLGWQAPDIAGRVDEMLQLIGLPPARFRDRRPAALSGGQRQRVGVARALAARPAVMLLDEPFGALDPITRVELQDEFKRIQSALALTAILVTHDMTEALLLADRVAVMQNGRIVQVGTPHELMTAPAHDYVRTLVEMPKKRADRLEALTGGATP
jgi:osmoprotectant transport system ATP-binding protein